MAAAVLLAIACPVQASLETELEEGIGRVAAEAFIAQRGRMSQPILDEWLADLGAQLVAETPRHDLDYRFIILDTPEANGFALPGGWVFVTAGLLETIESEDELAAVLAHELAHLADRDFQRNAARTALWYGVSEVLRNNDREDWLPLVHGAALVNILRHSRRQESQADDVGARIAWRAGYDPRALADFLGNEASWSYLETVFATHPHPAKRIERVNATVTQLRRNDPESAVAVARSLASRGRRTAAIDILSAPLQGAETERLALLEELERPSPEERHWEDDFVGLREAAREGLEGSGDLLQRAAGEDESERQRAWRRLRAFWGDQDVRRALLGAQAIDPELGDMRYLVLVAQAADLMRRTAQGANLIARALHMHEATLADVRTAREELMTLRVPAGDLEALERYADQLADLSRDVAAEPPGEQLARLAGDYHEAARMTAPLLLELLAAGRGDPLGDLVFSRFLLLEAQVRALTERINDLDGRAVPLAAARWRAAIVLLRTRLNIVGIRPGADRDALLALTARRTRTDVSTARDAWDESDGLGDAALSLVQERAVKTGAVFGSDLRAMYVVLRLNLVEAEEARRSEANRGTLSEGEDPGALRGAVGHPQ